MSARDHRLEGRWRKILRTMPVLPEIPGIADWLKAQKLEITADQNPAYAGQTFDPTVSLSFPAWSSNTSRRRQLSN